MKKDGMTLLELTIAMGMTVVVAVLGFIAVQTSGRSMAVATAQDKVQGNVRNVLAEITRELELAASVTNDPFVEALEVSHDQSQPEVTFQIPLDTSGTNWSSPITYRYVNEDLNYNNKLDEGEDEDGDGLLTRRIIRIEDGEERLIGGANDLSHVDFYLEPDGKVLQVMLTSTTQIDAAREYDRAESTVTSRILLLN